MRAATASRASSIPARRPTRLTRRRRRCCRRRLEEALAALRADTCLAEGFGKGFVDYYLRIKEAEIARYQSEVTEWEQKEYFELF